MLASLKEAAESDPTREEEEEEEEDKKRKLGDPPSISASPSSWLRLKDPRIVRVSRAFGGKDRHSKVCTVRGLRDRRVRLSVPTAIQLYDLQERLGLNQPSKAVDWLLNAAKHEIHDLPPLQIPPGCFSFNQQIMLPQSQQPNNKPTTATGSSDFWNSSTDERDFTKRQYHDHQDPDQEKRQGQGNSTNTEAWQNNSLLIPFGATTYHFDHQTFGFTTAAPTHHLHNFNFVHLPSTLSLSSPSPTHHHHIIDPTTISDQHLQMLRSASQTNNNNIVPPLFSAHQSPSPFHLNIRHVNAQSSTTPDIRHLH